MRSTGRLKGILGPRITNRLMPACALRTSQEARGSSGMHCPARSTRPMAMAMSMHLYSSPIKPFAPSCHETRVRGPGLPACSNTRRRPGRGWPGPAPHVSQMLCASRQCASRGGAHACTCGTCAWACAWTSACKRHGHAHVQCKCPYACMCTCMHTPMCMHVHMPYNSLCAYAPRDTALRTLRALWTTCGGSSSYAAVTRRRLGLSAVQ